jgi:hypothetical protein
MFVVLQFFFLLKFNTIPSIHSFISEITSHYYFIVVIWLLLTCLTSGYKPLFILIYTILYTYYTYVYVVVLIVLIFLYLFASWYKPKNHNILYHLILYIVGTILYKIHSILELNTSPAIKLLISYSYTLVLGTGSLIIHNIFPTSLLNKPLLVILGGSWLYKFNSFNLL